MNNSQNSNENLSIRGMGKLSGFACKNLDVRGMACASHGTVAESASIRGTAELEHVTIQGDLDVRGMTNLEHVTVGGNVHVRGMTNIEHCSISGKTEVRGTLNVEDSTLHDVYVSVASGCHMHAASIERSTTDNITIEGRPAWWSWFCCGRTCTVKVELNDAIVEGDITFVGRKGTVIKRGSSRITGQVIGGTVVEK